MPHKVSVSEPALKWIEEESERIARDFGPVVAEEFKRRLDAAIQNIASFPDMMQRGHIPGSKTVTVNKRTILTVVERDGEFIVAAARSHWQHDAKEPHEVYDYGDDDEPESGSIPGP